MERSFEGGGGKKKRNFLRSILLEEHIQNLNHLHVQNGASGYAKYAFEYLLKDYKDENGNVISDPEMTKITKGCFLLLRSEMRS